MFLRCITRKKNGKEHRYWSIVENRRVARGRVVQRHVLYLGEINTVQEQDWQRSIEIFEEREPQPSAALPAQTQFGHGKEGLAEEGAARREDAPVVRILVSQMELHRPRQWGACWLAIELYEMLGLHEFFAARLPRGRKGKIGEAKGEAGRAFALVDIQLPAPRQAVSPESFRFAINRQKLRMAYRREGRYLLRSNLCEQAPARLWELYMQLTQVEEAFRNLKGDLAIRPIYHQHEDRMEAHIFISFVAYCMHVTLGRRLRDLAPGLTPRAVLEKFAAVQMIDVHLPTSDGRQVIMSRSTQPEPELKLLLKRLKLELPEQAPPRITAAGGLDR
jgi:hypothetical protein